MTAYEPCELHEITNCSVCTGLDKRLAAEEKPEWTGATWTAQHPGKCPRCGEFFDVGATIYSSDSGWMCCK